MTARIFAVGLALSAAVVAMPPDIPTRARSAVYVSISDTDTTEKRIAVVMGDSLIGMHESGESVQLFVGRVRGYQDSTTLRAARAKRFVDSRRVLFTGNVVVVDKGDSLFADSVYYDEVVKTGRATGSVRLSDGEVTAFAPSGTYFIDEKRAVFTDGLRLVDSAAAIGANGGTYWTEEKRAEVAGNVRLEAERTYLEADSVTYHREEETALARGNVFIERLGTEADSSRRTLLFGPWAFNDELAGFSRMRGYPTLVQLSADSAGVDTLVVTARELASTESDTLRRLVATGHVRYWQVDHAAAADSMVYERVEAHVDSAGTAARTHLFGKPALWVGTSQVTGDTISVRTIDDEVDSLFVQGGAFVARQDSVLQRIHQVRGKTLTASFNTDSTRVFVLTGNAESLYYRHDEENAPDGAVHVTGDEAVFHFHGDDLRDLAFGSHQGTYYPESALTDRLELEGFSWMPEAKPSKAVLLEAEHVRARLKCDAEGSCRRPKDNQYH